MKGIIKKMSDILGGLFLFVTGIFLLFLYYTIHRTATNWFITFLMILFLWGLGLGGIILGTRRIILTIRKNRI